MPLDVTASRIQPDVLRDKVYRVICDSIISGQLRPGEALVEGAVSKRLGVSRVPVREAFYLLEKNGYIKMIPHKGAFVTLLARREVEELCELRMLLEVWAICRAPERLRSGDIEQLENTIEEMEKAAAAQDYATFYAKDREFHCGVCRIQGNRKVEEVLNTNCASFVAFIMMIYSSKRLPLDQNMAEHKRLLQLIKNRSSCEEISGWVEKHIESGRTIALEFIESHTSSQG